MSKFRIGITEAGDAGLDLSWIHKLNSVNGAVLVTKNCNTDFISAVMRSPDKLIVHATVTGYGGTQLEPNVPTSETQFVSVRNLIHAGFPVERIVARVDPIIPTEHGIQIAEKVILDLLESTDIRRFRISVLDSYPHVRKRFKNIGIEPPYGDHFQASGAQFAAVDEMLLNCKKWFSSLIPPSRIRFECCAEPGLKAPAHCGCISDFDLYLLGLEIEDSCTVGFQRKDCLCYGGKVELLSNKHPCSHNCLYCYWQP